MTEISERFSMTGWDVWTWIKGRKRSIVSLLGTALAYYIRPELTTLIVGPVFEAVWAVAEYFFSKVELKEKP